MMRSYRDMHNRLERTQDEVTADRNGIQYFIKHNKFTSFSFLAGIGCIVITILFTSWLSHQVLTCPKWALYCDDPGKASG